MTSTHPHQSTGVDVAATSSKLPFVALVLGILSIPGSILTWDSGLPGGQRAEVEPSYRPPAEVQTAQSAVAAGVSP